VGVKFSRDACQQLLREQSRHFRWRFVNTGRPHIELLAQRMFADLQGELQGEDLTVAADWLVEAQQDCWRIVCEYLEEDLVRSLRDCHDSETGQFVMLQERLGLMARDLEHTLAERAGEDENPDLGDDAPEALPTTSSPSKSFFRDRFEARPALRKAKSLPANGSNARFMTPPVLQKRAPLPEPRKGRLQALRGRCCGQACWAAAVGKGTRRGPERRLSDPTSAGCWTWVLRLCSGHGLTRRGVVVAQ